VGEGARELLGESGGSGCGQLYMQLLRTDLSSLSLIFWKVDGAGQLFGGNVGRGCGQLSMQLPRTDMYSVSLTFEWSFGWGNVLGNCWRKGLVGVDADDFPCSCCGPKFPRPP
jgi:hypothetical protein